MTEVKSMTSLLVGSHFRPPAKIVLANLKGGTILRLEPEPENPYDEFALKVLVDGNFLISSPELEASLEASGHVLEDLLEQEIFLGFVAATGGKPLRENPEWKGNRDFLEWGIEGKVASLGFDGSGKALVRLELPASLPANS